MHPLFNPVTHYRYLLPNLYLSVADIAIQTCLRVLGGPGLVSTSSAFMRSIASHPAGPHGWLVKQNSNRAPIAGGVRGRHNLYRVCQTAVTAPPRVGYVVWSQPRIVTTASDLDCGRYRLCNDAFLSLLMKKYNYIGI